MNSVDRKIFKIALPSMVGFLGLIVFESVDTYWVGKLSANSVAAVGAASFVHWAVFALMHLSVVGCSTYIAQFVGANKKKSAHRVFVESFWLSLVICALIGGIILSGAPYFFKMMGLDSETQGLAWSYFRVFGYGIPIFFLFNLSGAVFEAHGDTKTNTMIMISAQVINIVLDPLLIFGWAGFPKLGIMGASVATLVSECIGMVVRLIILRKRDRIPPLKEYFQFSLHHVGKVLKVGIPSSMTNFVWCMVFPMLTVVISKFGMTPLAGMNVALRFEGIPYFMGVGLKIAMGALTGQAIGSEDFDSIRIINRRGVVWGTILLLPICILFVSFPREIIGLLNSNPEVIKHGADYLRIVGLFEIFLAWELVFEGSFNGLGYTKPYMFVSVPLTLARVPIAYVLAFPMGFGIMGVWWAISLTTLVKGWVLWFVFNTNQRVKVILKEKEES